ncbi:PaaI family thioesterase [Paraconexibacter sp.]|uniref:PaaI family thioesterase n=1 Tax=Paraconexibacter sp. TaxID=2949640 RepID=UPI003564C270
MDYAAMASGYETMIPFAHHIGVKILDIGPGTAVAELPEADELKNHVNSQHAGALFTVAEAASGGAFLGAFAEQLATLTPLAERAEIAYRKIARGPITATSALRTPVEEVNAALDTDGKARFEVGVDLTDAQGVVVAEVTVHWYVRRNPS